MLTHLKELLGMTQTRMKHYADRHRSKRKFNIGDQVLLKIQPYHQLSIARRENPKLAQRYFGPYKVLDRIGEVAYRLELRSSSCIHDVIHVSKLKLFHPSLQD